MKPNFPRSTIVTSIFLVALLCYVSGCNGATSEIESDSTQIDSMQIDSTTSVAQEEAAQEAVVQNRQGQQSTSEATASSENPEQENETQQVNDSAQQDGTGTGQPQVAVEQDPVERGLADQIADPEELQDWLYFRGNAKSNGVAQTTLPDELEVLWEFTVEKGAFFGTPTIVDDGGRKVFIADADGTVYALNLETGEKIWSEKHGFSFNTAPVFRDSRLYLGDIDGKFVCLDASNGKEIWTFEAMAEINSSANFYADKVIFGSQDTKLYALNAETGELAWELENADQVRCSVTVVGDVAFVAGCDGHLRLVDLENGTECGAVDIRSPTGATPAILDRYLYCGTEGTGFVCIDWVDVEVQWEFESQSGMAVRSSAAITPEHVVFAAGNRVVYSLDPKSGDTNWEVPIQSKTESSPVIVGDRVYIGGDDGRLYTFALEDGEIINETEFNGGFTGSPAAAYERLVFGTARGVVYCLGASGK